MAERTKSEKGLGIYLRMLLCVLMAVVLATGMTPLTPHAFAANDEKPKTVKLTIGSGGKQIDVAKEVATLDVNMGKGTQLKFNVEDSYSNLDSSQRQRKLVFEDSSGKQTELCSQNGNDIGFDSGKLVTGQKLKLITSTKDNSGNFVKRYEVQLNVRVNDSKPAEQKPAGSGSTAGISGDGGSWSFSNGLQYTFKNTGLKFLDGTTMNLGALKLPLTYKHKPDGTTIAGINCSPEDEAFFKAVKNGNVWQKYSTDELAKKTGEMDKGWSGKKFGTWGGKSFDWNVCGFMEYNTQNPNAPRALNLIISTGLKAEGHAQYLCFTGTLTFTVGGKAMLMGKLTPGKGVEGKFGIGAYAGLELYIGLGLQYVASVGAYGKGQINIDFQTLPDFYLDTIKVSGSIGAKAKVFGFTVYTWEILKGEKLLFDHSKVPKIGQNVTGQGTVNAQALNEDGTASSPLTVDADTPYPVAPRGYLDSGGEFAAGQSSMLTSQDAGTTVLTGIYDQTELSCATTSSGPVMVYVADAKQVSQESGRDDYNRSAVVYKRMKADGTWSDPKIIDNSASSAAFADYSPSITADGDTCYVSWLAADSQIAEGATLGQVGQKLDVKVATITSNDTVSVETVHEESGTELTMPANPKAVKASDGLYVGWYTNQTSGQQGEVIGVSGSHNIRLYKRSGGTWSAANEVTSGQSGAITSFDVGLYGGAAACVWSLDEDFQSTQEEMSLNGVKTLASSTVSYLSPTATGIVSQKATNAQFAKRNDADVLTYAEYIDANDGASNPYLNVQSSSAPGNGGQVVLDGSKVYLPTPYYEITGDLGNNRKGNISFTKAGDGTCDIQALVTTGAGAADWTSIVEATPDTDVVTDYCATYYGADGKPLFIYATDRGVAADGSFSTQEDDGAVNLNQTTEDSLKHLSVFDVDYDEYEVDSGQQMPVTVYFNNDGLLDVSGVDLWLLDGDNATVVASSNSNVPLDGDGSISFNYTVPARETFTKAREFTVYATPKGATGITADKIKREVANESAMTVSLGDASLSLEVEHQIVDDQESIVATVTNDGIVPHAAQIVYLDSDTGDTLKTVDVSELGENEEFTDAFDAPTGYFQNDGVNNITITIENDGTEAEGYEINNTEFVSTWEIASENKTPATEETPKMGSKAPATGDQIALWLILLLLALAVIASPCVARGARKTAADEGDPHSNEDSGL